jgi:Lipoprotein LpqB beta-propeller domain/Sporulation and spore germination
VANRLRIAALGLILAASLAGCVSLPSGGPVVSSTVTQGPGGQGQQYMQLIPKAPVANWDPAQIVEGFLAASASSGYRQIARQYLAHGASWNPTWSAIVYSQGPNVNPPVYQSKGPQKKPAKGTAKQTAPDTATVTIGGKVQAILSQTGGYAVPDASQRVYSPPTFGLVKVGGQWRIESAPPELLLNSLLFNLDYQLRNLYFFDQSTDNYLVPDPAYVPLQASPRDLVGGLVSDLIKPPGDWLSPNATQSAFPAGTRLINVSVNGGEAMVNLAIPKGTNVTKLAGRISAQLLYTLTGSGQGPSMVGSVELSFNGVPWSPPGSQQNPVQQIGQAEEQPPSGASSEFYYVDSSGWLVAQGAVHGTPTRIVHLGKGYSQIAVSPGPRDSQYVALLTSSGSLYAGPLGGKLAKQRGSGYLSMSWDPEGDLWANTTSEIWQFPAPDNPGQPLGQPVQVLVDNSDGTPNSGPFTGLRVAPDGVRMAIIVQSPVQGSVLYFGAINYPESSRASQPTVLIKLSPFDDVSPGGSTAFESVSWYGSDHVITLSAPNQALAEYPVNGGSSTALPSPAHIESITASDTFPLIAGLVKGGVTAAPITGLWPQTPLMKTGFTPVYPG